MAGMKESKLLRLQLHWVQPGGGTPQLQGSPNSVSHNRPPSRNIPNKAKTYIQMKRKRRNVIAESTTRNNEATVFRSDGTNSINLNNRTSLNARKTANVASPNISATLKKLKNKKILFLNGSNTVPGYTIYKFLSTTKYSCFFLSDTKQWLIGVKYQFGTHLDCQTPQ